MTEYLTGADAADRLGISSQHTTRLCRKLGFEKVGGADVIGPDEFERLKQIVGKVWVDVECAQCGSPFKTPAPHKVMYCSDKCRAARAAERSEKRKRQAALDAQRRQLPQDVGTQDGGTGQCIAASPCF